MAQVIQYWHNPPPPVEVSEAFNSFASHNPGLVHRIFDRGEAITFIAENYSTRELEAFRACAVPAMQADYLRYCAVLVLGGAYIDADFKCLGDISQLAEADGAEGLLFGRADPLPEAAAAALGPYRVGRYHPVNNSVFAFRQAGHPFLRLALDVATANIENRVVDGAPGVWLTAGPGVFTSMYLAHRLGSLDAFLEYCTGRPLAATAPWFCDVVGDWSKLDMAWAGVRIRPRHDLAAWLQGYELPLESEGPEAHWKALHGSIFAPSA